MPKSTHQKQPTKPNVTDTQKSIESSPTGGVEVTLITKVLIITFSTVEFMTVLTRLLQW